MISVSSSEPDAPFRAQVLRGYGIPSNVEYMVTGDYAWDTVGVERKEAGDLLTSLCNGRLEDQLARMVDVYEQPILLREGVFHSVNGYVFPFGEAPNDRQPIPWIRLQQFLVSWQFRGITLIELPDATETMSTLVSLYNWTRSDHDRALVKRKILPNRRRLSPQAAFLAQAPGVGPKSAEKLAMAGSVRQIVAWPAEQLKPFVGAKRAEALDIFLDWGAK